MKTAAAIAEEPYMASKFTSLHHGCRSAFFCRSQGKQRARGKEGSALLPSLLGMDQVAVIEEREAGLQVLSEKRWLN